MGQDWSACCCGAKPKPLTTMSSTSLAPSSAALDGPSAAKQSNPGTIGKTTNPNQTPDNAVATQQLKNLITSPGAFQTKLQREKLSLRKMEQGPRYKIKVDEKRILATIEEKMTLRAQLAQFGTKECKTATASAAPPPSATKIKAKPGQRRTSAPAPAAPKRPTSKGSIRSIGIG